MAKGRVDTTRKFYIGVYTQSGNFSGHAIAMSPDKIPLPDSQVLKPKEETIAPEYNLHTFNGVFSSFVSSMESYRSFIFTTLFVGQFIAGAMAQTKIVEFAKSKGKALPGFSTEHVTIYELDFNCYRDFTIRHDEIVAAVGGIRHLPGVLLGGLVSTYDGFLSELMRAVAAKKPETFFTSEKTIKGSDLHKFLSIEEARASLIDSEIESVIRLSHHEQFEWMQKRFAVKLKVDLPVWPKFVELCERRNLLTHTGGIVSAQYIENCAKHKCKIGDAKIGQTLLVDVGYYSDAVNIIYEIGAKLCHVLWRKFFPEDRQMADTTLNELGYNLIYSRVYPLAEVLLRFGVNTIKSHHDDSTRRMMVINLANSVRLQEKRDEANKIIDREDWSACNESFQICSSSVKGDINKVIELMRHIGTKGVVALEQYRTWPVFRELRTNEDFLRAIEEIFGEPLIVSQAVGIEVAAAGGERSLVVGEKGTTVH